MFQQKNSKRLIIGVIIGTFLVIAFGALAMNSLPGSGLYGIKTQVIEDTLSGLHFRSQSKANYQVTLLTERLSEAKRLGAQDTISEAALASLQNRMFAQHNTLHGTIDASIDSAFPKTELLYIVNEFASVAGALENVTENDKKFGTVGDEVETIRQDAVQLYKDRTESFIATEESESVFTYMHDRLSQMQTELSNSGLDEETIRSAENYLDRVAPAIAENNFTKALLAIGESYRIIKMSVYTGVLDTAGDETTSATEPSKGSSSATTATTTLNQTSTSTE